jgi:hypothetical protein
VGRIEQIRMAKKKYIFESEAEGGRMAGRCTK